MVQKHTCYLNKQSIKYHFKFYFESKHPTSCNRSASSVTWRVSILSLHWRFRYPCPTYGKECNTATSWINQLIVSLHRLQTEDKQERADSL